MRSLSLKQKWLAILGLLIVLSAIFWPRVNVKEIPLSIDIHYTNIPKGLTIIAPPTKVIEVVVSGPKSIIDQISKNNTIHYELDLSKAEIGMNAFPVQLEGITLPADVSVLRSNLSLLIVKVDKLVQKELPIQLVLSGKPGSGFIIVDSIIEPSRILLSGPETILGPLTEAKTKPIEINGVKDSLKKETMLDLPEDVQVISSQESFLSSIFIEEKIIIKSFEEVLVAGKGTTYTYSITPPVLDLKVKGPQNLIDKLSTQNGLEVFINLSDVKPGVYVRFATIRMPVDLTLVYVKPEIFTVSVAE